MNNQLEKGLITFSPLAKGQLTDRYLNGIPADSWIRTDGRFLHESDLPSAKVEQLRKLNDLAAKRGEDLSVMALRWILDKPGTTSVLIGASKPEQILKNLHVLDSEPLSEQGLEEIDRIAAKIHEIEAANA